MIKVNDKYYKCVRAYMRRGWGVCQPQQNILKIPFGLPLET